MISESDYFLDSNNFEKQYNKLTKKLKNKKVVIYGAGELFQTIERKCDLKKLNIIALSDGKFSENDTEKEFLGYKKIPMTKIEELKPDYVLVSILNYIAPIENLEEMFSKTSIKVRPLIAKTFLNTVKDVWSL